MRFYRLHTPLPYLLATRTETLRLISEIGFTLEVLTILCNDSGTPKHTHLTILSFVCRHTKNFQKGTQTRTHTYTYTRIYIYTSFYVRIRIHFDTSAQCILAITDYSSTERMCIQYQRSSYITITTAIYTDYYRTAGRVKFTFMGLWRRFDETVIHLRRVS